MCNRGIKLLILFFFLITISQRAFSQDFRNAYINIGFSKMGNSQKGFDKVYSMYGAQFSAGKTFYLNKTPIGDILKFGIDATWIDLNYNYYEVKNNTLFLSDDRTRHNQADIAMQVGLSANLLPADKVNLNAYFRYAPTYSLYLADDLWGNYANIFVGGLSVSYGVIGLGFEGRFGSTNYKLMSSKNEWEEYYPSNKIKTTMSGFRAFLTFRF